MSNKSEEFIALEELCVSVGLLQQTIAKHQTLEQKERVKKALAVGFEIVKGSLPHMEIHELTPVEAARRRAVASVNAVGGGQGQEWRKYFKSPAEMENKPITTIAPESLSYGIEDAARVMGISSGSVRRLVQKGDIPAARWNTGKNGKILIKRADLEKFLEGITKTNNKGNCG